IICVVALKAFALRSTSDDLEVMDAQVPRGPLARRSPIFDLKNAVGKTRYGVGLPFLRGVICTAPASPPVSKQRRGRALRTRELFHGPVLRQVLADCAEHCVKRKA